MDILTALQTHLPLLIGTCLVAGLLIGSFLNVVIHRLPIMLERAWQAECAYARGEEPMPQEAYNLVAPNFYMSF